MTWLLFGGLLFGVRWLVGVYLLGKSPAWRRSEKLPGTLVLPGGLVSALSPFSNTVVAAFAGGVFWTGQSLLGVLSLLLPLMTGAVLIARRRRFHKILLVA